MTPIIVDIISIIAFSVAVTLDPPIEDCAVPEESTIGVVVNDTV